MSERWMTSWSASATGTPGTVAGPDATIRQTMRISLGGEALRLRLGNPHGYAPLVLDSVTVARSGPGDAALAGAALPVTVGARRRIVVHPGQRVWSDPVPLSVRDREVLAVSVYAAGPVEASGHAGANRHTWSTLVGTGDHTAQPAGDGFRPFGTGWLWLDAIEVRGSDAAGTLVAIGDSLTDGAGADFGTDGRWTDVLAERMAALPPGDVRRRTIANAGIGGNTLAGFGDPTAGVNVVSRLERDALALAGVTEVLVFAGSNDLHLGGTADEVAEAATAVRDRIRERGMRALIATLIPRIGGYLWTEACERERVRVNRWIRERSGYDAVLDFDAVLEDPARPARLRPEWDADGTHPTSAGYRALGSSIDLELFRHV